jgi:hypothetical protein
MSNEYTAKLGREFHPLRFQRWAFSDLNPWLAWLKPAAGMVQAGRQALGAESPSRRVERMLSEIVSASLDYYRAMRDATSEATFFQTYGNMFGLFMADQYEAAAKVQAERGDPRELPFVKEALASIEIGGYPEALTRVGALLASDDVQIPLAQIELKRDLAKQYAELLPDMTPDQWRRTRGEQDIIVRYARERAIETLPRLLDDRADRERFLTLLEKLAADPRLLGRTVSAHDRGVIEALRKALSASAPRLAAVKKTQSG